MAARRGRDFARRALQLAADDPGIIANSVFPLAYFGENIGAMIALLDQALILNPNFARGWFVSGHVRVMAGHCGVAIKHVEHSLRLSPRARVGSQWGVIGMAHFFALRFDEAVAKLYVALQEFPGAPQAYRFLAAAFAHMGRFDEARAMIAHLRAVTPLTIPHVDHLRNPEHRDLLLSGLRLAAGEAE